MIAYLQPITRVGDDSDEYGEGAVRFKNAYSVSFPGITATCRTGWPKY
jgi:hypothetical protein